MIVPTMVILMGINIKIAVGTALSIAAIKSYIGFGIDWMNMGNQVDWQFLFWIVSLMIIGILSGSFVANHVPGSRLKKGFAFFILLIATMIVTKEVVLT